MTGYKVFNPDWTCRDFQYEVGKTYEMNAEPKCCNAGFHFCERAVDCFSFYDFNLENKVAEVEALGKIDSDGVKSCTNKIKIMREISWEEVLKIVNMGKACTGFCNSGNCNSGNCNSGNCNSGDRNSGDCNSGNYNSGNCNSGNWNSGNRNSGNCNSGNCNSGNWNSGNCNSGDWNSGDWNKTSFSSGCFNTKEAKILMFNKPSDWTFRDWWNSEARRLLNRIQKNVLEWVWSDDMTDEEKEQHPDYKTTGGYLKELDESECGQIWWNSLTDNEKDVILSLPNFDAEIFEQVTGVHTEG